MGIVFFGPCGTQMFFLYVTPLDFSQQAIQNSNLIAECLIICTRQRARQSPISRHNSSFGLFDLLTFRGQRDSLETLVKPPAVHAHLNPAFALKVWRFDL